MKDIVVTGCNGTVGRYVTGCLLGAGYRVLGISRECASVARHENFNYYSIDLANTEAIAGLLKQERLDALVHLAAIVHVRDDRLGFEDYCRVNYLASKRLFELAATNGAKGIMFASTVEVYGPTPQNGKVDETAICRPDSDYGRTKMLAEAALTEVSAKTSIDHATLRFAPVYAPDFRLNVDRRLYVAPHVAYQLGWSDYRVSLCSVHNIEHFVLRWLSQNDRLSGIFNLCDERSYPISELLARESLAGRARLKLRIPYWPSIAAVAAWQTALNLVGRSAGMYTADNIRKLVRSTHWDPRKAVSAVGPLPWNIENTMAQTT